MDNTRDITQMSDKDLSVEQIDDLSKYDLMRLLPFGAAEKIGKNLFPDLKHPRNKIYASWANSNSRDRATVMRATSLFLIKYRDELIEGLNKIKGEEPEEEPEAHELAAHYKLK